MRIRMLLFSLLVVAPLATAGCGGCETCDQFEGAGPGFTQAPDFALEDQNPNSTTHLAMVSPRDHVGRVSAWYFGFAT